MIDFYIPKDFIPQILSGEYIRYGAIIKNAQNGQIIGHLKEAGNLSCLLSNIPINPVEAAKYISNNAQLLKIQDTLNSLQMVSSIGSTASILNLGITVAGFAIVINKLNRIENKLDSLIMSNKEIALNLKNLNINSEYLLFAKIKTALDNISKAEITDDIVRKKMLLNDSSLVLSEIRNYYDIVFQNIEKLKSVFVTQDHLLLTLQRYFSVNYSIINIEFMLNDYKNCHKEILDYTQKLKIISESSEIKKIWFKSGFNSYRENNLSIIDYDKLLEKAKKNEIEKYNSIIVEELARVESLNIELDYLKTSKIYHQDYIAKIKELPDDIILIPIQSKERIDKKESKVYSFIKDKARTLTLLAVLSVFTLVGLLYRFK